MNFLIAWTVSYHIGQTDRLRDEVARQAVEAGVIRDREHRDGSKRTGTDIVRVNYRSNPAVVTDLIAGHIPMAIPDFNLSLIHI